MFRLFALFINLGLLLRVLPRSDSQKTSLHFIRGSLILSISLALYFGSKSIKCDIAGPVSILCMCAVASMSWKRDNSKKVYKPKVVYQLKNLRQYQKRNA